jgi:hypothetical protein
MEDLIAFCDYGCELSRKANKTDNCAQFQEIKNNLKPHLQKIKGLPKQELGKEELGKYHQIYLENDKKATAHVKSLGIIQ